MAGELAAARIAVRAVQVVGIDRHESLLLTRGRRKTHRPGNVEHQIEIDVARQREARRR